MAKRVPRKRRRKIRVDFGGVESGKRIRERGDPRGYDLERMAELAELYDIPRDGR